MKSLHHESGRVLYLAACLAALVTGCLDFAENGAVADGDALGLEVTDGGPSAQPCDASTECPASVDPCTVSVCLASGVCDQQIRSDVCVIDGACYDDGVTSPFSQCDVCDLGAEANAWSDVDCDDGNVCTADTCDAGSGCASMNLTGTTCDDGRDCNEGDACVDGQCLGTPCGCAEDCSGLDGPCQTGSCEDGTCVLNIHEPGTACEHPNPCILDALCDAGGTCLGTWDSDACPCQAISDCDDGLSCTMDACDLQTGSCSNPVTTGACLLGGACTYAAQPHPMDPCLTCQPGQSAAGWTAKPCDDGDSCTVDTCHATTGECDAIEVAGCCALDSECLGVPLGPCETATCVDGTCQVASDPELEQAPCDDGDACTSGELCRGGVCSGGVPMVCPPPSAACLVTECVPSSGACVEAVAADGAACDDGDACTVGDECAGEECAGEPIDCSVFDGPCTASTCDSVAGGCTPTVLEGMLCDDDDPCTDPDLCLASGICIGVQLTTIEGCGCEADTDCDDGLACTNDICLASVCIHPPIPGNCMISGQCYGEGDGLAGNSCLVCAPALATQTWSGVDCDDGNSCTDTVCDANLGCIAIANDAASCDDGDPCTDDDHCEDGSCVGYCECTEATDCGDFDAPACQKVACENYTCVAIPDSTLDGSACDDGLFCWEGETCESGSCGGAAPTDCSAEGAGLACMVGACDDVIDTCKAAPSVDGTACDDGDPCSDGDACSGGACAGVLKDCSDLGDQCRVPFCDETGTCQVSIKIDEPCDDGDDCTLADACTATANCDGTWDEATCGCESDASCESLDGQCAHGTCDSETGECYAEYLAGLECDDGNPCTFNDVCGSGGGCSGEAYTCSSGVSCEVQSCDGGGGCNSQVLEGFCVIGGACVSDGTKDPDNSCQKCDSSANATAWSERPDGAHCNADDSGCTAGDACSGGVCLLGPPPVCDDGVSCTQDSCQSTGSNQYHCVHAPLAGQCFIDGMCFSAGDINALNACTECAPGSSQVSWSNSPSGVPCGSQSDTACDNANTCNGFGTCADNYEPAGTDCGAPPAECKMPSACSASGVCLEGANWADGGPCTATDGAFCADCEGGVCSNGVGIILCQPPDGAVAGDACQTGLEAHCGSCKKGYVPCSINICAGGPVPYVPGVWWLMVGLGLWWRYRRRRAAVDRA